jgi:AraC-like DNA-binding protein
MPGPLRILELHGLPGNWRLFSAPPAPDLTGLVCEYWGVEGHLSPFREKVLPNGCVELMVNLGPPHRTVTDAGKRVWTHAWLSGLRSRALIIESLEGTHLVSARLHPLGARDLLGGGVPEAANTIVELDALLGCDTQELRERLAAVGSPSARFELLEGFLRRRLSPRGARDPIAWAARRIEATHGSVRISDLHAELGCSRKHLSLAFTRQFGIPPKTYAQIQRFAWVVTQIQETTRVDWAQLAGNAGYSDQSHLARDFQRVAASSPTAFLRERSSDGTTLLTDSG